MRITDLPFLVSRPKTTACIYLSETAVALSCSAADSSLPKSAYSSPDQENDKPHVLFRADPFKSGENLVEVIKKQVMELGVEGAAVSVVLAPDYYALNLLEKPDVDEAEVNEALRWRLQENLDYPAEQAVIDTFSLPETASGNRQEMVFVVSTQRSHLQSLLDGVLEVGLTPDCVDITEMALRNIAQKLFPAQAGGIGLLRMTPRSGIINISQGDKLYLSRRLTSTTEDIKQSDWEAFREGILLQVQRSMDYHESALSQPPPSTVLVTATLGWEQEIISYFSEMLPMKVVSLYEVMSRYMQITAFNPDPVLLGPQHVGKSESRAFAAALPALGGLLRRIELAGVVA